MLEYSYGRMAQCQLGGQKMDFNAFMESFAVHARVLHDFLVNDAGSDNYEACDFVDTFKAKKPSAIDGAKQRLNRQIAHPGKKQAAHAAGKFTGKDCTIFYQWISGALDQFISQLDEDYQNVWTGILPSTLTISAGQGATATNAVETATIIFKPLA